MGRGGAEGEEKTTDRVFGSCFRALVVNLVSDVYGNPTSILTFPVWYIGKTMYGKATLTVYSHIQCHFSIKCQKDVKMLVTIFAFQKPIVTRVSQMTDNSVSVMLPT